MTEVNSKPTVNKTKPAPAPMNVYQKLIKARKMFLENGVAKSGKNMAIQFKYFELEDIVPAATQIFEELGLITIVNFRKMIVLDTINDVAEMTVVNADNPTDRIEFVSPMRFAETNKGVNPLQALGSSHTYMRRYLYMMALDIVEADKIDCDTAPSEPAEQKTDKKPETREEAKAEIVSGEKPADEMQIKALSKALKTLRKLDPEQDEFVQNIVLKTAKFTKITSTQADALIGKVQQMIAGYNTDGKHE